MAEWFRFVIACDDAVPKDSVPDRIFVVGRHWRRRLAAWFRSVVACDQCDDGWAVPNGEDNTMEDAWQHDDGDYLNSMMIMVDENSLVDTMDYYWNDGYDRHVVVVVDVVADAVVDVARTTT